MKKYISIQEAKVGDKIKFSSDRISFTIKARSESFIICTRPKPFSKSFWYTIIDTKRNVRGPNNLVLNHYDYTKQEDIDQCLLDLEHSEIVEVSYRNELNLDIQFVYSQNAPASNKADK